MQHNLGSALEGIRRVPDHVADIVPYCRVEEFPDTVDQMDKKIHYRKREAERTDPDLNDDLANHILQHGYVELHDGDDPFALISRRHVKCRIDGQPWSLVVEVMQRPDGKPDRFELITGFCPAHHTTDNHDLPDSTVDVDDGHPNTVTRPDTTSDPNEAVSRLEQTLHY